MSVKGFMVITLSVDIQVMFSELECTTI